MGNSNKKKDLPRLVKKRNDSFHDKIKELAEEIESIAEDKEIKKIAKKIAKCAEEAKSHGQSMEDRLYEYRSSIEEIGFKRIKKN